MCLAQSPPRTVTDRLTRWPSGPSGGVCDGGRPCCLPGCVQHACNPARAHCEDGLARLGAGPGLGGDANGIRWAWAGPAVVSLTPTVGIIYRRCFRASLASFRPACVVYRHNTHSVTSNVKMKQRTPVHMMSAIDPQGVDRERRCLNESLIQQCPSLTPRNRSWMPSGVSTLLCKSSSRLKRHAVR